MEVFRDDDEIAGQILSKELEEALAASSTLVVACSPDARASRYVSEEITTFKKLHPNGNIVPVLVRGLPNNVARQRGMDAQAAFPDILETVLAPDTFGADVQSLVAIQRRGTNSTGTTFLQQSTKSQER